LGQSALASATLKEAADAQVDLLASRASDLRFAIFYIETRRQMIALARRYALPAPIATCKEIDDITMKIPAAIGVHLQITQAWVEAQSCMGRGTRDEVRRAAEWLAVSQTQDPSP
jgi:hypothetical protein